MNNYKIFSIPCNIIPNLDLNENGIEQFWEMYDDECQRKRLYLNDKVLSSILSLSGLNFSPRNGGKKDVIQHIKYNLKKGKYIIDEHRDSSYITIIVYLTKSSEVSDQFWIENKKVDMNKVWENDDQYQCLIFWGNNLHHGKIHGKGNREILCFFTD